MADHALATIDNPSSALTDFTLVVDLSNMPASWWSACTSSDGTRGRVYKGDGTTRLACDWIDFDDTNETGILRVLWSGTLASSGTQQLWIEPPVSGNDAVAVDATYGQYNAYDDYWNGYWPLAVDGNDRTINQINMSTSGSLTFGGGAGLLGASTYFSGSGNLTVTTEDTFISGDMTVTAVLNTDASHGKAAVFARQYNDCGQICVLADETIEYTQYGNYDNVISGATPSGYFSLAVVRASNVVNAYIDGVDEGIDENVDTPITRTSATAIGAESNDINRFVGYMQHIAQMSAARSAVWIATEHSQISANSDFYTTWSWVTSSAVSIPVILQHLRNQGNL